MKFKELIGRHRGQTAWIVGKGPSLAFLRAEHFGAGPVIALNQAIVMVEALGLSNMIYSLQKDGCGIWGPHESCEQRDGHDWMIRPQRATLMVQEAIGYSRDCLPDYAPRVAIQMLRDLKFPYLQTMAVRMGIATAKQMGCVKVMMLCCDSLVNGNLDTFNVWTGQAERTGAGNHYEHSKPKVMRELVNIKYQFVTPAPPPAPPQMLTHLERGESPNAESVNLGEEELQKEIV
jgi:NADH:ubiquinone oxidoreductase, NADH-binding (51 kD) subunit